MTKITIDTDAEHDEVVALLSTVLSVLKDEREDTESMVKTVLRNALHDRGELGGWGV